MSGQPADDVHFAKWAEVGNGEGPLVPKQARERYGFAPKDDVCIIEEDDGLRIVPAEEIELVPRESSD